jgi:hypothetical protein
MILDCFIFTKKPPANIFISFLLRTRNRIAAGTRQEKALLERKAVNFVYFLQPLKHKRWVKLTPLFTLLQHFTPSSPNS